MTAVERLEVAAHTIIRSPILGVVALFIAGCAIGGAVEWRRERSR
jgi:hypothetical protein